MSAPDDGLRCLTIPTPFLVGPVNCYLVEDEPLTLVDTGPNSGTALTALETGMAEYGYRVEDLERIVLTHQHIDHIGLAAILQARSGAEVIALDALAPWLAGYGQSQEADDAFSEALMHRHGIPEDLNTALRAVSFAFRAWGAPVEVTRTVSPGDELHFAGRTWDVHHRPGHSPSDTVFHDQRRGVLIAGDHLIRHISSNPLVSRPLDGSTGGPRPQALVTYLASLAATRQMDLRLVLPGHGEAFSGHVALIDDRFAMHERRARKIGQRIASGPRSAYEIARDLWGNIAVTQAFLTLSEVLGHVDLLTNAGEVVEVEDADGVVRFACV